MWAGLLEGEHGRCCDFRFVFVLFLNLGGCGLMGVGRFCFITWVMIMDIHFTEMYSLLFYFV